MPLRRTGRPPSRDCPGRALFAATPALILRNCPVLSSQGRRARLLAVGTAATRASPSALPARPRPSEPGCRSGVPPPAPALGEYPPGVPVLRLSRSRFRALFAGKVPSRFGDTFRKTAFRFFCDCYTATNFPAYSFDASRSDAGRRRACPENSWLPACLFRVFRRTPSSWRRPTISPGTRCSPAGWRPCFRRKRRARGGTSRCGHQVGSRRRHLYTHPPEMVGATETRGTEKGADRAPFSKPALPS